MNTLVAVIIISLINCAAIWLSHYFGRSGHNAAEKEDIKEITYLSESGKNLATKEDIEEITKKIEVIKNEVSFENQRKHQFIEDRTNRLLKILRYSEELRALHNQLTFLLYDETNLSNHTEIIKETNKVLTNLGHECRMVAVIIDDDTLINAAYDILKTSQIYCAYFCHSGSVHISLLHQLQAKLELYKATKEEELTRNFVELRQQIEKNKATLNTDIEPAAKEHYDATINYVSLLKKLYNKDFHLRYDYEK